MTIWNLIFSCQWTGKSILMYIALWHDFASGTLQKVLCNTQIQMYICYGAIYWSCKRDRILSQSKRQHTDFLYLTVVHTETSHSTILTEKLVNVSKCITFTAVWRIQPEFTIAIEFQNFTPECANKTNQVFDKGRIKTHNCDHIGNKWNMTKL